MALVSRIARVTVRTTAGDERRFEATAVTQDTAAGSSVDVTITNTATGTSPPDNPNTFQLSLRIDNTATIVRTFTLNTSSASQTVTFFFTNDGLNTGTVRAGTLRLRLSAVRSAGLAAVDYNVNSDDTSGQVLPAGWTVPTRDQGWVRGTTTALVSVSNVAAGGAKSEPFTYPDSVFHRVTLGAAPYESVALSRTFGPLSGSDTGATAVRDLTLSRVDRRFPSSVSTQTASVTCPNAGLATGLPEVPFTVTDDSAQVDPRLTFSSYIRHNSNTFSLADGSVGSTTVVLERLPPDLSFLWARVRNARGVGVTLDGTTANGKVDLSLFDTGGLITPIPATDKATSTQDGQAGWLTGGIAWDESLPGGDWTLRATVNDTQGVEGTADLPLKLLAPDPRIATIVGGGSLNDETDHFVPGDTLIIACSFLDRTSRLAILPDFAPSCSIARLNTVLGRREHLLANGTWEAVGQTQQLATHTMRASAGDAQVFIFTVGVGQDINTDTSTWASYDLIVQASCEIRGAPYGDGEQVIVTGKLNSHSKYEFDPALADMFK